jgi:hypothetical protein
MIYSLVKPRFVETKPKSRNPAKRPKTARLSVTRTTKNALFVVLEIFVIKTKVKTYMTRNYILSHILANEICRA